MFEHTTPVGPLLFLAVAGPSMEPTLGDGDWILAWRGHRARRGDVVVAARPDRPDLLMVKRITEVRSDGLWLVGDNPEFSTDSRNFGVVPSVLARVLWRVRPWGIVR